MRLVQCRLLARQAGDAAANLDLEDINVTGADHRVIMDSRIVNVSCLSCVIQVNILFHSCSEILYIH